MNIDICRNCDKLKLSVFRKGKYKVRCDFAIYTSSTPENKKGALYVGVEKGSGIFWCCHVDCVNISSKNLFIDLSSDDLKSIEISGDDCPHYVEHLVHDCNHTISRKTGKKQN